MVQCSPWIATLSLSKARRNHGSKGETAISAETSDHLADLFRRVHDGDEAALAELLQQYEPRLRTAARVLLGPLLRPHLDTVDLVQSVHRVLLPGLRAGKFSISCPDQLVALAVTVIRRKVARNWRRLQHEQQFTDGERGPKEALLPSRGDDDPASAAQLNDEIRHLLAGLSPDETRLVQLRLEGYSTVEIAEKLGCEAHALRATLSRLRQRLRAKGYTEWV
jgi:RNA polymerase sigma factor (sigma-70 family)